MIYFKHIKNIFIFFLLLNSSCTNTRVILEGTKKVINHTSKEQKESTDNKNYHEDITKLGILIKLTVFNMFPS